MAKEIRDKSDIECNFYQSAEDVPDPRKLSSEEKNLMVLMICYLKNKPHVNRIMSEEDTATSMFLFSSKLCQTPSSNNPREREFHMSVSTRPEAS